MTTAQLAFHLVDPVSSREAATRHAARAAANANAVLAALEAHPDYTGAELAAVMGRLDVYEVRRRLSDLKGKGKAEQGDSRACRVAGTSAVEWRAI